VKYSGIEFASIFIAENSIISFFCYIILFILRNLLYSRICIVRLCIIVILLIYMWDILPCIRYDELIYIYVVRLLLLVL